ncbi:MAG: DUF222 domain-containing protein [Egibacteraceae bacterium]
MEAAAVETLDDHALLDLAEHVLAALGARPLDGQVDDIALAESVERLHRLETVVAGEKLRRVAQVDARGAWRAEGARSTADLLARRLRLTRGEARAQAETAVGLEGLPETAAAVRAGTIGVGQAQVAVQTAKELRPDVREELDRLVAGDGGGMDRRRQLRERVDEWTHTVDPDALGGRERRAWANRRLSMSADTPDGVVRGGFELDPLGGATLRTALDPLARKTSRRRPDVSAEDGRRARRARPTVAGRRGPAAGRGPTAARDPDRHRRGVGRHAWRPRPGWTGSARSARRPRRWSAATPRPTAPTSPTHPPLTEPATGKSWTRAARNASRRGSSGSRSSPETRPASAAARPRPAARCTDHANLPHPPTPKEHATWGPQTRTTSA